MGEFYIYLGRPEKRDGKKITFDSSMRWEVATISHASLQFGKCADLWGLVEENGCLEFFFLTSSQKITPQLARRREGSR